MTARRLVASLLCALPALASGQQGLATQVEAADRALFRAIFDDCDAKALEPMVTADFEFYHDKWGQTARSGAEFVKAIAGMCERQRAGTDFRARRELDAGSSAVFPMKDYGALHVGRHRFFRREAGRPDQPTERAQFANLWKLEDGRWRLARVFSFDHVDAPGRAPQR